MLKRDFPVLFNNVAIKGTCLMWERGYTNISNSNMTEAGTDDVEVIRRGKTTIAAEFQCSDFWASKIAAYNALQQFEAKFYDVVTKTYTTMTVRMDGLIVTQLQNSDALESNGAYDLRFNLLEF